MIHLTKNIEEAQFVTHAGNFHADDVFSSIFLERLIHNITLIRLKDYQDDGTKLAYDIGLGAFDHHGAEYDEKRENGIHYCSFGLLWKSFGLEYLKKLNIEDPEKVYEIIDELLVIQIDAFDNGEFEIDATFNIYTLSSLIEQFRPKTTEDIEDECFLKACSFADLIFEQVLKEAINKAKIINIISKEEIKDKILILKEYIPYEYAVFKLGLDVEFAVYPSNRGGYAAHTIPTKYKGFISKVPFKKEWAGLRDNELQEVSGIKTARFCHKNLFLATADTKEDALMFIKKTRKG